MEQTALLRHDVRSRGLSDLRVTTHSSEFTNALGQVKDAIGEWHDWEELQATAQKVLKHGSKCGVLRELKERCAEKYDSALRSAEDLRRKYLRVSRDGRKITGNLPAKSVSAAIADMAA